MCLAIPSKIIRIEDGLGTIDVDGVRRTCSLLLLEDAKVGDWSSFMPALRCTKSMKPSPWNR
jgi:hypothetical protein